jgi:lipopolysaccharide transport system ATP-binding protein
MAKTAISVTGIAKRYRLGERERYETLRETVMRSVKGIWKRQRSGSDDERTFWALRDLSFEIPEGQIVGLIGRNGAGKSTMLKILSRITAPTEGRATIHGRVGSLLEVGVGFHPELTGRENVYLNGAILGMRRAEIQRKFDEVVAFAEVERFLDTPVKRYSSGMYVRLAFSVAAHLEPEILLVDEVLAVGDTAFQKKCMGKMGSVARDGRTILFVSHNLVAITSLCERGILLDGGRLLMDGSAGQVVERYLQDTTTVADRSLATRLDRRGDQKLKFTAFELRNQKNEAVPCVASGQDAVLAFTYEAQAGVRLSNVKVAVGVHGKFDESLFHLSTTNSNDDFESLPSRGVVCCRIPSLPLQPGNYTFNLFCTVGEEVADWIQNAATILVEPGDFFKSGRLPPPEQGPYLVPHSWFEGEPATPESDVVPASAGSRQG